MNTGELLYKILGATDNLQKNLYKYYFIDDLSINTINKINPNINKHTVKKYLNTQDQSAQILQYLLTNPVNISDKDIYKNLVLTTIKRSYQTPNSSLRVSRNTTKIINFFGRFIDNNISLTELPMYIGFILLIKSNNIHIYKLNINKKQLNTIKNWEDKLLIRLNTKDARYIPMNYKTGKAIILKYIFKIINSFNSNINIFLESFYSGIDLFVLTRYKPENFEIPLELLTDASINIGSLYNRIQENNTIVLENFKKKFRR